MDLAFLYNLGALILEWAHTNHVQAEAFIQYQNRFQLQLDLNGDLEKTQKAQTFGLGIRIIDAEQRGGFAGTTNLSEKTVLEVLDTAKLLASFNSPDKYLSFPKHEHNYSKLKIFNDNLAEMIPAHKIDILQTAYQKAIEIPKIKTVSRSGYTEIENHIIIVNTNGINAYGHSNQATLFATVIAEGNERRQNGSHQITARNPKLFDPALVARTAAEKALALLGYQQITSTHCPVILAPEVSVDFLQLLAPSFSSENVRKQKSYWSEAQGQTVASPLVDICDEPTDTNGMGAFPFDAEGVATRKLDLIKAGHLQNFFRDHMNAIRNNTTSTGNAIRSSFFSTPTPGAINLKWLPGKSAPEDIIASVDYGVYINAVMGLHTANTISGNFSLGAKGFLIENGTPTLPLGEITLAGNLFELLEDVEAVGYDFTWFGNMGAPTVKISQLSIGGN